jgi:Tfp pilus assembly protein PilF
MDAAQEHAFGLSCHLFLSFAQLRTRRYRRAAQHGLAALAIAELHQSSEGAKSALWLLGEAAKCSGSVGLARAYFSRLQRDFYPRGHQLVEGLLDVDLPPLVNLMA